MTAKLQPNRVRRTYLGGGRIDAFCGVSADVSDGVPRPEDWLASTTQAFNGTLEIKGEGLGRLEDGRLVKDVAGGMPILVKLLDSDERLVVQAHPTVPCAKRLFDSPVGKTECWYFLPGTAPDACVYLGFKPGVTRERWERAVWKNVELWNCGNMELWKYENVDVTTRSTCSTRLKNPLLEMLHRVPVAPGDFVFVDGGVPHAIGGGCFMIELQEPSDLMVVAERLTPSGRRIPDAKMHGGVGWERMFDVYEYEGRTYDETCAKYVRRAGGSQSSATATDARERVPPVSRILGTDLTDKFEMWRLSDAAHLPLGGAAAVAVVVGGEGTVNGLAVRAGDRLLVAGEDAIAVSGDVNVVVCK